MTKETTAALCLAVPISVRPGISASWRRGRLEQRVLMGRNRFNAQRFDIVDGRAQADSAGHVGRTRFELVRQFVVRGAFERHVQNHVAATLPGRHLGEQFLATVEHTDAGGPIKLVAREGIEVRPQRLDVHTRVGNGLCTIHQHRNSPRVSGGNDFRDRQDGAERIRDMRDRHQPRPRRQQPVELIQDEFAVLVDGRHDQGAARGVAHHLPGHDVGVVLQRRDEDLIARSQP